MNIRLIGRLVAISALALTSKVAFGEKVDPGAVKFETCSGCHSRAGAVNAVPRYHVPKLGGQHADYLIAAIEAYASGDRRHGTMEGNAKSITEQDSENIAAFVSKYKLGHSDEPVTGDAAAGKEKAQACAGCHGVDGNSTSGGFPRLAGQYQSYLIQALKAYQSGSRNNPMMAAMVGALNEDDIENIAAFYATQQNGLVVPTLGE